MKKCHHCGEASLPDTLKYCYKCGNDFFPSSQPIAPSSQPSSSTLLITGGIGLVVIFIVLAVLVVGGAMLVLAGQQPNSSQPSNSGPISNYSNSNVEIIDQAWHSIDVTKGDIYCADLSNPCESYNFGEATIYNNSQYDLGLQVEEGGCFFDFSNSIKPYWNLDSGEHVNVKCSIFYTNNNFYQLNMIILYPQSGSNQATVQIGIVYLAK